MEFIDPPKPNPNSKFRIRNFVQELKQHPNCWAIYRRVDHDDDRRAVVNVHSAVHSHRSHYPDITWQAVKDDLGWYIAGCYEPKENDNA